MIADDISHEIGRPYTNLDNIDLALRTGKDLTIYQRNYRLARMKPMSQWSKSSRRRRWRR